MVVSMARPSSIKPGFRESRKKAGIAPWVVNVPSELSETGKRQEIFFSSKAEAQTACNQLRVRKDNFGNSLAELSSSDVVEGAKAFQMLEPTGIGLVEAVSRYLTIPRQRTDSIVFSDLCDRYLD